jgi:ATP-dependent Clp protease ATP-binding subunit ClpA/protein subunit release factor A
MPPSRRPHPNDPQAPEDFRALLASVGENLAAHARAGEQWDVYDRESEIEQILQALAAPLKGRVVVVGPARAGKSAVVQAIAARLGAGRCPAELAGKEVWRITPGSLIGSAPHGRWQHLLERLMAEWAGHPEVILYFDEITRAARLSGVRVADDDDDGPGEVAALLANSLRGNALDLATGLATALKRHAGLCLAEAEESAWRRFAEQYTDYGRVFLPVRVEETDLARTRAVAGRVAQDLGILHNVTVTDEAIEQAIDLSQRYALDRAQPGKTIDLLSDTLAVVKTGDDKQLTADGVIRRFHEQSGLPRFLLDDSISFNEDEVLRYFKQRVLAQDQAVEAIVQALSLLRARVNNPLRPMGVFLFLGPTGVGKTELARALAEYLYGTRDRLMRFNMADYAHWSQQMELFGNPHARSLSDRRGQLTNRLADRAFSVIVLDEFEKAHPLIYQRFLQLYDEGLLINGNDETVNLRNSIFILTSNFGAQMIERGGMGFPLHETPEAREKRVLSETERYFTPEFINRMDAVCLFRPLTQAVMANIARREISDLLKREGLTRRQIEIDIADEVIEHVVAVGYSPRYGARYLKRQIEKTITYPLARELNALPPGAAGGALRLYMKHGRVLSAYLPPISQAPAEQALPLEGLPVPVTLAEIRESLPVLTARVEALEERLGLEAARVERDAVLAEMTDVNFWNDQASARRKLDGYQRASSTVDVLQGLRQALESLAEGLAAPAPSLDSLTRPYKFLSRELPRLEFTSWLSGPHDACGAYVIITVKSKSPTAREWVGALAKMYLGWARRRGLTASVLGEDQSPEGRTLTLTLAISGFGVYGLLQGENGTHRLVQTAKVGGQETLQRLAATVIVVPELSDEELPPSANGLEIGVKELNRNGLLLPRLIWQVTVRQPGSERRVTLSGNLPPDDLTTEAARLLRTRLQLEAEASEFLPAPPGGVVRSYIRSTRDKGVHDHRTGRRTVRVKQVLEGDGLQDFLDEALRQRGRMRAG